MTAEAACFHCGLPVAAGSSWAALVDGQQQTVCCPGCKAVAEAIAQSGLSSYYRSRTAYAARAAAGGASRFADIRPAGIAVRLCALAWASRARDDVDPRRDHLRRLRVAQRAPPGGLSGVLFAEINYAMRRAHVRWDDSRISLSAILAQVESIGYRAWPATSANAEQARRTGFCRTTTLRSKKPLFRNPIRRLDPYQRPPRCVS